MRNSIFSGHLARIMAQALAERAADNPVDISIRITNDAIDVSEYHDDGTTAEPNPTSADGAGTMTDQAQCFVTGSPMTATSFKFQLGSEVTLETSREAIELEREMAREQREQQARRDRHGDLGGYVGRVLTASFHAVEQGIVIARAEYTNAINSYLVRYRGGDGRQVEVWLTEDAIFQPDPDFQEVDEA